jgi:hypothetical protein
MSFFEVTFLQPDRNGGTTGIVEADSEVEAVAVAREAWNIPESSKDFPHWTVTAQ